MRAAIARVLEAVVVGLLTQQLNGALDRRRQRKEEEEESNDG